ncbi:MAG: DNA gyrase subunit A [Clostridiales bacterium]|nr:DNA gyrase subunit A [Clostridiales bacterium]
MEEKDSITTTPTQTVNRIVPIKLENEMKKSFISYAMAVIINRALPDVRDGLKPVHRRILYSMDELGLQPDKPFRKSARIVGDCLGKYHPHGDSSVYDAMVRLAQDFSTRYMLVEGHGNFGSVDGDGAAAMRYTEARMSKIASEMMADIEKDTVDFMPNFDETLMQPTVLPSRFPNILVNGSGGIAVGMATNIPPHNLGETIDALCALIDDPEIDNDALMQILPGPDFPTGGIIMGLSGIASAYRTGRGRIVVRARAEIEAYGAGKSRIIITEIPYQVNKARLVERIAELVHEKRVEGISDLRDETDRTGMRVVIELKKDVNANVILNQLYKHTDLQSTFGVIMLMLVDGEPKILPLRDVLYYYLEHQKSVVTRRTTYDLNRAKERLHILEGLIIALDNIDEIVDLIKKSGSPAEAKQKLIDRFSLSELQAQAILDMRLQRLTGLERDKILDEDRMLRERVQELQSILDDEHKLLGIIKDEALAVKARHSDARRTEITQMIDDIDLDDVIQEEDMAVTMTHFGYIKRLSPDTYRAQNRGGRGVIGQGTHEEDFVERLFVTSTHSHILFFTNMGRAFKKKCYAIPEAGRNAKGMPIVNLLQLGEGEKVTAMFPVEGEGTEGYLVMATRNGIIKKTPVSELQNIRKGGLIVQSLREGDALIAVEYSMGDDEFIIASRKGKCVRFAEEDVRPMGRTAMGVRSINLSDDDEVVDMVKVRAGGNVLTVTELGMGKRTPEDQYPLHHRGGKGVLDTMLTEKTGDLACLKMTAEDEDVMLIRDDGTIIRLPLDQVNVISRNTQGVRLMRVDEGTRVVSVEIVPHVDEEEPAEGEAAMQEPAPQGGEAPAPQTEA